MDHAIRRLKDHELSSAGAFGEKLYCMFINRDTYQQYLLGSEVFGNCDIAVDNAVPHFKKWTFALFELANTFLDPSNVIDMIHSLKTERGGILCSLPNKAKKFTNLSADLDKKENYQLFEALPAALKSGDLETVEKNILSLNEKVVDAVIDFSATKDPWLKKREKYFKEFFHFYFDQKIKLKFYYSYKIAFIRQDLLDKWFSIGDCDAATKKVLEKWKNTKEIALDVALLSLMSSQHKEFDEEMQTFLQTELAKDDADAIIKPIPVIDRDYYAKTYSEKFNQHFKVLKELAKRAETQKV